tara:strand:+ start:2683 stop:2826 length:144 start_codon:yes stop_codon:yes gene_type:complete
MKIDKTKLMTATAIAKQAGREERERPASTEKRLDDLTRRIAALEAKP